MTAAKEVNVSWSYTFTRGNSLRNGCTEKPRIK